MQINWFTVIAQVVNFFILVWLLRRFLYHPILKAIDEREARIAAQLADAESQKTVAQKEKEDFRQKNEGFDQKKQALMDQAVAETQETRQQLLDEARKEANLLQEKLEKSAVEMQQSLGREIATKAQQEVFSIARKTLSDLASASLETQSTQVLLKRLKELDPEEKQNFITAFQAGTHPQAPIQVRSAFELPEKEQADIQSAVREILGSETQFQFEKRPELISGIELATHGYKLAWSISEYLLELEKHIPQTVLKKQAQEKPAASEKQQNASK